MGVLNLAEQGVLNSLGGKNATDVLNAVNPIGAGRSSLLQNPQLGNITSVYAEGISKTGAAVVGATTATSAKADDLREEQ